MLGQKVPYFNTILNLGGASARLLVLRVLIPPGAWMSVSCEYCVVQVGVSAMGRSLAQGSPSEKERRESVCVCVCLCACARARRCV